MSKTSKKKENKLEALYSKLVFNPFKVKKENTLSGPQVALLMELVCTPSATGKTQWMNKLLRKKISNIQGCTMSESNGNIYVTKGDISDTHSYPCVVAHTDTVHDLNFNIVPIQYGDVLAAMDGITNEQFGTGGDDKVGIFMALDLLAKAPAIKAAFFRDEERGCLGSKVADMDFFNNCGLVLQADRKGRYDLTESISGVKMLSKEFMETIAPLIAKHKREYIGGAMTDVYQLVNNGLKVCACNMSCGYYQPHSRRETINLLHVEETLNFMSDIIYEVGYLRWDFERRTYRDPYNSRYNITSYTSFPIARPSISRPDELPFDGINYEDFKDIEDKHYNCELCGSELYHKKEIEFMTCNQCYEQIMEHKMPN